MYNFNEGKETYVLKKVLEFLFNLRKLVKNKFIEIKYIMNYKKSFPSIILSLIICIL